MLPLLKAVDDGEEHIVNEIVDNLADQFRLTESDRAATLSSGQRLFHNRAWWARTYLLKAGLLVSPARGKIKIRSRGLEVLRGAYSSIDYKFLMQFPEFVEWKQKRGETEEEFGKEGRTPQESIESDHRRLCEALAQELLEKVKGSSWEFFERLVIDLLVAMGYGGSRKDVGQAIGRGREVTGMDGVIKEDKLGLDVVYVQAKRWKGPVGVSVVSSFSGSLEKAKATKGVLITTSWFTDDAKEFVKQIGKRVVLIGGEELTNLMISNNVGVTLEASYEVKKLDLDYFEEAT